MKIDVVSSCNHCSGHPPARDLCAHYYDGAKGDRVCGHNFPPQAETKWLANKTTFMPGAVGGW